MSARRGDIPPYLPPDDLPVGLVKISASWTAVSLPSDWGRHVRDVPGDRSGPVMEDLGLRSAVPAGTGTPAGRAGATPSAVAMVGTCEPWTAVSAVSKQAALITYIWASATLAAVLAHRISAR
jgi:hypothetical protein